MAAFLLFDLIVLAVLVIFTLRGAWRGLVLSLCSLLAVVVAFAGPAFWPAPSLPWWPRLWSRASPPLSRPVWRTRWNSVWQRGSRPCSPPKTSPWRVCWTSCAIWGSTKI